MENAAKALLIAGSILLGIIVLSLFMIMINSLTDYQQAQTQNENEKEVIEFNNQYAGYMRDNVSGADVFSLINKVVFYNRTKSTKGTGDIDTGVEFGYEPIELVLKLNNSNGGNQTVFALDGNNKLFKNSSGKYTFNSTISTDHNSAFQELDTLLNKTKMPEPPKQGKKADLILQPQYRNRTLNLYYNEAILKGLLDNYNSTDSIFSDDFLNVYDEKKKRKCFLDFNIAVGKVYFPSLNNNNEYISVDTMDDWWKNWIGSTANQKGDNDKTIRQSLALYYEYVQFQRGKFKYVDPPAGKKTYSDNTGRVIYMEFEFTGEFL